MADTTIILAPERAEKAANRIVEAGLTPEEYAGLHGESTLLFTLDRYVYQDMAISEYVKRLGAILNNPEQLAECQRRYGRTPETIIHPTQDSHANVGGQTVRLWRRRRSPH